MQNEMQNIGQLSEQLGEIIFGTFFFLVGLVSASIALVRRGKDIKILIWLAAWSGAFGARLLIESPSVNIFFPQFIQNIIPAADVIISYMILVFALLTWVYLVRGKVRTIIIVMIIAAAVIAVMGIAWFFATGNAQTFMLANSLMAAATLIFFAIVLPVKELSNKYLVLPNRGVLAAGTVIFVVEALYTNLSGLLGYRSYPITGWIGFAVLILALAYSAAKIIFTNERKLITIENEMETARQIQSSILPGKVPEIEGLKIAAAYYPMTSVAGDYYEFVEISKHEAGFLVADVSGHGVPAALIASMIKIAMQSVISAAKDPGEVLSKLAEILGSQLHSQFVTAAYLYIDSENNSARYAAAGHPPLLYWNSSAEKLETVESNGLLFGVFTETEYPVRGFTFNRNDRFIIYTDGLTETRNAAGDEFGNKFLGELININSKVSAEELSKVLLDELKFWQDKKTPQQDDITFVIVDRK
jgi:phosphoserine phosphatase RsbU/P